MNKIFCIMGKSSTGKDSIYRTLINRKNFNLKKIIPYTTRPVRVGEQNGREYYFCDEEKVTQLNKQNKIIELREYKTVHGIWKYFTADDGQIDLDENSYLLIGTLETFISLRKYYGVGRVIPIYIEVEDGERLARALERERKQSSPRYEEMCRRFLADQKDFSKENLNNAMVDRVFMNNDLQETVEEIVSYINSNR